MTEALCLKDAYQKECDAAVLSAGDDGRHVVLDQTVFYAQGGGQPTDHGAIKKENAVYMVKTIVKTADGIAHEVDKAGLQPGDKVHCAIDWERRYKLMRYHTAAHLLSALVHQQAHAEITGNQLDIDKGRIDFNLEEFSKEKIESYISQANELIQQDAPVKAYTITKEEALKDSTLFKLATKDYIEKLKEIRIVEIVGIDKQADGGTHVRSLKEVGKIQLLKTENKGKNNRRVYFVLV